jgi:transketolase
VREKKEQQMTTQELDQLKKYSAHIRANVLKLMKAKKGGHLGGSLSIVEALSVLYGRQMRYNAKNPQDPDRDYFVLSKGHAGPGLYSALSVFSFFDEDEIYTLNDGGTRFPSHPDRTKTPGVDATTGSLGQGISVAAGIAYALKLQATDQYVYCIVGDGELNEGQCWEAFQFIASYKLNNLIVIIDENKRQLDGYTKDIIYPFDIVKKMRAFGFSAERIDGRSEAAISDAIDRAKAVGDSAVCIVLDTIKGQGVPYFENIADNHSVKLKDADISEIDMAVDALSAVYREAN